MTIYNLKILINLRNQTNQTYKYSNNSFFLQQDHKTPSLRHLCPKNAKQTNK